MESLEYYLLLVAIIAFGVLMPQGTKDRKQYIVIMTVLHSLLSGLRHPFLTGDMQTYCYTYWRITDQGWFSEDVFQEGKNFGFNWLLKFFSTLSDGEFQVFLIAVAIFIEVVVAYLIYKYSPEELRLILIDPKKTEFVLYNDLPHLMINEIITDVNKVVRTLKSLCVEMDNRYKLLQDARVRSLKEYNEKYGDLPEWKHIDDVFKE